LYDEDKDGRLDKTEFAELIRAVEEDARTRGRRQMNVKV
jgi:Ca2+-binding EF-hand superfamily protein